MANDHRRTDPQMRRKSLEPGACGRTQLSAGPYRRHDAGVDAAREIAPAEDHFFVVTHYAERFALLQPRGARLGIGPVADDVARAHQARPGAGAVELAQDRVQRLEVTVQVGNEGELQAAW